MLGWKGDQKVRDETLTIPGVGEVSVDRSGRSRNQWTEETIWFSVGNDSTVIYDGLDGCFDGRVSCAPGVKGELGTHEDFPKSVQWFATDHLADMGRTGRRRNEELPCHGLDEF